MLAADACLTFELERSVWQQLKKQRRFIHIENLNGCVVLQDVLQLTILPLLCAVHISSSIMFNGR